MGPIGYAELESLDVTKPGAPSVRFEPQNDSWKVDATVTWPGTDANGGPLTGLTGAAVVFVQGPLAQYTGETDDETWLNASRAALWAGWLPYNSEVSAELKGLSVEPGRLYVLLVRCDDAPR
jgi:hypothetical protein